MKKEEFHGNRRKAGWQQAVGALLLLMICFLSFASVKAEEDEYLDVYYFYNNPCETCHEVENFSADLRESFGSAGAPFHYNVIGFYIYGNEGSEKIKEVKKHFGISDQEISYPLVVAGENYLCGETKVKNGVRQMKEKAWEEQKQEAANTSAKLPGMKKAVSGGIIVILLIFALGLAVKIRKGGTAG